MTERQRSLPSWMSKRGENVKKDEPRKSRRKRKTASAVFYCMNEKELVEAAISVLHDAPCEDAILLSGRKMAPIHNLRLSDVTEAEESAADTTKKTKEECFTSEKTEKQVMEEGQSSDHSYGHDTTYVSETDMDTAELETLLYTRSPPQQKPASHRSGPVQDPNELLNVELEKDGNAQTKAKGDEDGLQLVREIFFS
ncbi:hypothetical protein fugu_012099 [Takifugu bimaculatus]|uniref:Modulator of retrovirus infection homolog n=1 Tax=Takifugu bimaculatus TaxID=433685 RepID=A0A4Z2C9G4_9TELE|nr:hypothetical protein fugu_012099 [Takifugu bimaculatus]